MITDFFTTSSIKCKLILQLIDTIDIAMFHHYINVQNLRINNDCMPWLLITLNNIAIFQQNHLWELSASATVGRVPFNSTFNVFPYELISIVNVCSIIHTFLNSHNNYMIYYEWSISNFNTFDNDCVINIFTWIWVLLLPLIWFMLIQTLDMADTINNIIMIFNQEVKECSNGMCYLVLCSLLYWNSCQTWLIPTIILMMIGVP